MGCRRSQACGNRLDKEACRYVQSACNMSDSSENQSSGSGKYLLETVLRACDVLESFRTEGEVLRLHEVASRTGLSKATVFRILHTLAQRSLIEKVGDHGYQLTIRPLKRRKYRLGYAGQTVDYDFSRDVSESITRAARQEGVELLVLDNRYNPKTAIHNADVFLREKVDLVIEFQTYEHVAPIISSRLLEANIPMIAIDIPHPGAVYFGADNYVAGLVGGRYLGRWAQRHWRGVVDQVVLLELPVAGALPASRLTGTLVGLREIMPDISDSQVIHLDGNGQFRTSLEVMRKHLRLNRSGRFLISGINDDSVLGALRAVEEVGRTRDCAAIGQNASYEARHEMRRPSSRMIGSVGYFPEKYGDSLIALAINILSKKPVPPAVFIKHQLIAAEKVNHFYPNDHWLSGSETARV